MSDEIVTLSLTSEEVQTLTAAMAGNFPPTLNEVRPGLLRKLAKAAYGRDPDGHTAQERIDILRDQARDDRQYIERLESFVAQVVEAGDAPTHEEASDALAELVGEALRLGQAQSSTSGSASS